MALSGLLVVAGVAVSAGPAHAAVACEVIYTPNRWNESPTSGGFTTNITVRNLGDPWAGWTLTFALPSGQTLNPPGWSATFSQSGQNVTAVPLSWNRNIGTGGSTQIGFQGRWSGTFSNPTSFAVNGVTCGGVNPPPTVSITSPANNTRYTAPASFTINATATDTAPGTVSKVEFYRDGMLLGEDTGAPYQWPVTALPVGTYVFQAKAIDNGGASNTANVTVIVEQSPNPGIVASSTMLTVPEGGNTPLGLRLSAAPSANVTVSLSRSGDSDITVAPPTLTFTPSNWQTVQNATVSAAEDADTTAGSATITAAATGYTSAVVTATESENDGNVYVQRFLDQYNKIKAPANGYFSPEGVPYHSIETLIVEAPDHGHETTSEAFSYWLWLEAYYGRYSQDWTRFNQAWTVMEQYIIPSAQDQPTAGAAGTPQYAAEHMLPSSYPSLLEPNVPVGSDPLRSELQSTYGTGSIYGMHWLLDVDNVYGFGRCGNGTTRPAYINTFQRGPQESVWETVPQPSCDNLNFGGPNGYLDLFTRESNGTPAAQWKYTNAPDADARAVQAAYWALQWATAQGRQSQISSTISKAAKMGDYLRYAMFDKYFKRIGNCVGPMTCPAGTGRDSAHYLMSWYYAWGGGLNAQWSWRIGSSFNHFGYQNPMAAYALTQVPSLRPQSPTAVQDWTNSFNRQLEFYTWLQSAEGGIAGGATNSWEGDYGQPPAGTPTFYGMFYDVKPVYHDPPSNRWFGMQVWSMQRIAELYQQTGNATAKALLDKWVPWAIANTTANATTFAIPNELEWTGAPNTWNPSSPQPNTNLHVQVTSTGQDVGVAAALARTLLFYAARANNAAAKNTGKAIIDALFARAESKGVSTLETREDYRRFDDVYNSSTGDGLYVPPGWTGEMPNGDVIQSGKSFLDIRSFYRSDPDFQKIQNYLNGGPAPTFTYHRFWAQSDVAMAFADFAYLFPNG
ncbi:glycoside hydrolase family 48 protein [Allorhizocola rhizosphaerae]|uniref:glycoside hydrolase family 48 protein n=1 Tax=Allorhizocola rhizosphaerae TaxID=1872709 RepID=UPI000E3E5DE7|nr:glycoside hydrolase family 48 protein [Allorhizocola rhizosphaerae]